MSKTTSLSRLIHGCALGILLIGAGRGSAAGKTGKLRLRLHVPADLGRSVLFSPDGRTLVTWSQGGKKIRLWDPATGDLRGILVGHQDEIRRIAFAPDGRTLATLSADRTIKLWDPLTGQERMTLRSQKLAIECLVFSPDSKTLATGSDDGSVLLWGAESP